MRDGATVRVPLRASRPWRAERCDPFRSVRLWGFVRRQRAPKSVPLPTATVAAGDNPCGVRRARVPGGQGGIQVIPSLRDPALVSDEAVNFATTSQPM